MSKSLVSVGQCAHEIALQSDMISACTECLSLVALLEYFLEIRERGEDSPQELEKHAPESLEHVYHVFC